MQCASIQHYSWHTLFTVLCRKLVTYNRRKQALYISGVIISCVCCVAGTSIVCLSQCSLLLYMSSACWQTGFYVVSLLHRTELCLCQQLAAEGILFWGCLWVHLSVHDHMLQVCWHDIYDDDDDDGFCGRWPYAMRSTWQWMRRSSEMSACSWLVKKWPSTTAHTRCFNYISLRFSFLCVIITICSCVTRWAIACHCGHPQWRGVMSNEDKSGQVGTGEGIVSCWHPLRVSAKLEVVKGQWCAVAGVAVNYEHPTASLQSSWSPASAICRKSSTVISASLLRHLRDPCIFCRRFRRELFWRLTCSPDIWNISALEVLHNRAILIDI